MLVGFRPANMLQPKDATAKAMPWAPDFSASASVTRDFLPELQADQIDFVQSVFIDNHGDAVNPVTLAFKTGTPEDFTIKCPAGSQGFFPVTAPINQLEVTVTSALNKTPVIVFYNIPLPYFVYPSATVGNVTANVAPTQGAFTNRSVVLTGGADAVMGANAARNYLFLKNRSTNQGQVTVTFGGALAIVLAVGEQFPVPSFFVDNQAITAQGTAGDTLEAAEA